MIDLAVAMKESILNWACYIRGGRKTLLYAGRNIRGWFRRNNSYVTQLGTLIKFEVKKKRKTKRNEEKNEERKIAKKKKEEKSMTILTEKILTTNEFIKDDNSLMRCRLKTRFISDLSKNASFKNHPRTKVAVSSFKPACSIIFTIVAHFISVFCSR